MPEDFLYSPFGGLVTIEELIGDKTYSILCGPLQGESTVRPLDAAYLQIKDLCASNDLLPIFDEVRTGIGWTGTRCTHRWMGTQPDIMIGSSPVVVAP